MPLPRRELWIGERLRFIWRPAYFTKLCGPGLQPFYRKRGDSHPGELLWAIRLPLLAIGWWAKGDSDAAT